MVAGFWVNQDGLPIQFGTQKPIPELGGDYLVYGETREVEQLIPLIPMQVGSGALLVPAPPTTFSGTGTPIAAGIQSMTNLIPLQTTAPQTSAVGGNIVLTNPQIFIEAVEVETLIGATGGASIAVGLVTMQQSGATSQFVQVAPNAGTHLINGLLTARMTTAGQRTTFTATTGGGLEWEIGGTAAAGNGSWLGNMPITTTTLSGVASTALAQNAWLSTIATGTFTNGLIKLRMRYTTYGSINV